eukprot:6203041-Pleurochrysis_carterae.AAC.1
METRLRRPLRFSIGNAKDVIEAFEHKESYANDNRCATLCDMAMHEEREPQRVKSALVDQCTTAWSAESQKSVTRSKAKKKNSEALKRICLQSLRVGAVFSQDHV